MKVRDVSELARHLGAIVGDAHVRAPIGHESRAAALIVEPGNADEVRELVRKGEADALTLAPLGAGRTLAQMRSAPVDIGISLSRMNRVIAYEPDDMTVIAEAGLTLAALNALTGTRAQRLPVDPPHGDRIALGALVAAAPAGPIRLSEGTVRDLLIGIRFAGHDARLIHGGGQVVKNVAGYDLMKVMTGSFGTLGIITETTFKVRPIPERYTLATASYPNATDAFAVASRLHDAMPLIHLEVVSGAVAKALGYGEQSRVLAGIAGNAQEVAFLVAQASAIMGGNCDVIGDVQALAAYERLRDFEAPEGSLCAQIAVAPAHLASCLQQCGAEYRAHAGSGIAQVFAPDLSDTQDVRQTVARWREIAHRGRGHLRVLRVNDEVRDGISIFDTPAQGALALMRRLKTAFDPHGIFNPGCFVGGL
jgi:glycolate oxidase FAD binding subunit